jgi:hypothetical protein
MALKSDGTVWAWGSNMNGRLGDGTEFERWEPVQSLITDVIAIGPEANFSLALKSDSTVWAWGNNNYGQLGDNTTTERHTPIQTWVIDKVVSISGGVVHSLAAKSDGTVWAWGGNDYGQLGDNTTIERHIPVQTNILNDVVKVVSGDCLHSLAITSNGTAWAWGRNNLGQLGDGTTIDRHEPVKVQGLSEVEDVAAGRNFSMALRSDGTVWVWGTIGAINSPLPCSVDISDVIAIGTGCWHCLAVKSDGTVWAWGANSFGQLGIGSYVSQPKPVQTHIITGAEFVAGGYFHSLAGCTPILSPPQNPYIFGEGFSVSPNDSVRMYWDEVFLNMIGDTIVVDSYTVYGSDDPAFVPSPVSYEGAVSDTFFEEVQPAYGTNKHYLVYSVSNERESQKSNMGYALWRNYVENAATTDKNWVSLPWHSEYVTVSDLTADLSSGGSPLIQITNLRDDQYFESWTWDEEFSMWTGNNFAIESGRGYEMITLGDTLLLLVGSNNPSGEVILNENIGATDKNWVSIPYNSVYDSIDDVTAEYSPAGDPLIQVTNLRDNQWYESWTWDDLFVQWVGDTFEIEVGRAYEFIVTSDTVWDPTEYVNDGSDGGVFGGSNNGLVVRSGRSIEKEREPLWALRGGRYVPFVRSQGVERTHVPGISHIIRCHCEVRGIEGLRVLVYRPANPSDVLTEGNVGSYVVYGGDRASIMVNIGNFDEPWRPGEEVVLVVEGERNGCGYVGYRSFELDGTVDIQELGEIRLNPIPEPVYENGIVNCDIITAKEIVGYSLYNGSKKINSKIGEYDMLVHSLSNVVLRPIFCGGYETVYGSAESSILSTRSSTIPQSVAMKSITNPVRGEATICYALPKASHILINIFDVTGRKIAVLNDGRCEAGYYTMVWECKGRDGRKLGEGVYFILMECGDITRTAKIIVVQ